MKVIMKKNYKNKKISFLFLGIAYSSSILVAQFIPEDLSIQNMAKTREFKGLNFSMNKAGHAIAVWTISDLNPDSGPVITGAIQAAYFNGTMWTLPLLNEFISDITKQSELP